MFNTNSKRQSEKGNVLFLILIAVALFAALSYVVTQSTRSGGGSTEREKNILSSAQMTQYPTALRTSIIRMVLGGVSVESIRFNDPSNAGSISTNQLVFHPNGGGAGFQDAPADLSASGNTPLAWVYNANFDVPGIGIDEAGGNDIIAFLPGVSQGVCKQVNEQLGITPQAGCDVSSGVPQIATGVTSTLLDAQMMGAPHSPAYVFPTGDQPDLECQGGVAFARQASGCFYDNSAPKRYVFYSVLLER